nr:uncharacterized protein LOC109186254 [Ipomoea trifida]
MKNAILPQVSSQIYSFGCSEAAGFPDLPSQIESELNVFSGDGFCIDSNLYTNQDNLGGVLAFCSESQIIYQSEPPSSMAVKRLGCPLGLDRGSTLPASLPVGFCEFYQDVHITKKTRKRSSPDSAESIAERAGKNVLIEETTPRIRRGRVPARRSQKLTDKITALQKLVSPYGKTDTASVLQEACISIKALQDQIQNLCIASHGHSDQKSGDENEGGLRNKGLCLVPVSLLQTVADQDLFSQMLGSMSCFSA